MPFGALIRNAQGTTIIGGAISPFILTDIVNTVSRVVVGGTSRYSPPVVEGALPCWRVDSDLNHWGAGTASDNNSYSLSNPMWFEYNGGSDRGNQVPIRYIRLGNLSSIPTGGYGLQVNDDNGNQLYNSNALMFQPDTVRQLSTGDTISIPNGKWVCPLTWFDNISTSGIRSSAFISRNTSSSTWTAGRNPNVSGRCGVLAVLSF